MGTLPRLVTTDIPRDSNHLDDRDTSIQAANAVIEAFNSRREQFLEGE